MIWRIWRIYEIDFERCFFQNVDRTALNWYTQSGVNYWHIWPRILWKLKLFKNCFLLYWCLVNCSLVNCSHWSKAVLGVLETAIHIFVFPREWHGGQRRAAITGQTRMVLSGQLATPPRSAQDHDGETRAQGKPVTREIERRGQTDGWISAQAHFEVDFNFWQRLNGKWALGDSQ